MLEKAQHGIWPSKAPLGFESVDGPDKRRIIQSDPHSSLLIKKILEYYATGMYSLKETSIEAARIGLSHRKSGNKLTKSALYDILINPIYYGDYYWKGVLYSSRHQTIISKRLFDKVPGL
jgi:hypothetical protein